MGQVSKNAGVTSKTAFQHAISFAVGFLLRPCCSIPAALALLVISGAGVAAVLAPYRLWFVLLAILFFSISFYWNFLRNRNRAGMVVWGLSVFVAAAILLGPDVQAMVAREKQEQQEVLTMRDNLNQVQIPVQGMVCTACSRRLERMLGKTPGVTQARVSFETRNAEVTFDPRQIDLQGIGDSIRSTGFEPDLNAAHNVSAEDR